MYNSTCSCLRAQKCSALSARSLECVNIHRYRQQTGINAPWFVGEAFKGERLLQLLNLFTHTKKLFCVKRLSSSLSSSGHLQREEKACNCQTASPSTDSKIGESTSAGAMKEEYGQKLPVPAVPRIFTPSTNTHRKYLEPLS